MASVSPADLDDWVPAAPPKASRPAASVAPADLDDWVPAAKPKEEERPGIIAGTAKAGLAGLISGTQDVGETLGKPATERKREYYEDPITAGDLLSPSTFFPKLTYGLAKSYPMLAGGVLGGIGGTAVGGAPGGLIGGTLGAMGGSALQALGPNLAQAAKETSSPDEAFDLAWKRTGIETAVSGASWALFGGIAPFKNAVKKELASFIGEGTPAAEVAARTAAANKTMGTLGAAGSKDLAIQALGVQPAVSEAGRVASNVSENRPALQGVGENYVADVAGAAVPAIGHAVAERGYHMLRGAPKPAADATTPPPGAPPADGESSQTPGADAIQAVLRANQLESAAHNDKTLTPEQRQAALDEARGLREKHSFPGAKKPPPAAAPTGEEPAPEPPAPPAPAAAEPAPEPPAPAAAETPASAPITKVSDGIVGGETLFGWQRISQSDAFDPDAGIALGTVTKEERAQLAAAGLLNERGNLTYSGLQDLFAERDRRAATGQRQEATLTPEGEARLAARRDIRQPIGTNGGGHPIYEDENGVRSYGRDGVRVNEPVQMIPTREGYRTSVDRDRRGDEFKTDEERAPAEQPENPAAAQNLNAVAESIRQGKPLSYNTNGDGTIGVMRHGLARADEQVPITLTKEEKTALRFAEMDASDAKTPEERAAANEAIQAVLKPAAQREIAKAAAAPAAEEEPVKVETPADMAKVRARTDPDPSAAEVHDGTAEKGRGDFQGIPFTLETAKGDTRTDKHNDPPQWSVPNFPADYGEIERTVGADKEPVDAYFGPNPQSPHAYIVDQIDPATRKFDEHKVLLGFDTENAAIDTYFNAFPDGSGPSRLGNMSYLSVDQLKDWLKNGNTKKPFALTDDGYPPAAPPPKPTPQSAAARGELGSPEAPDVVGLGRLFAAEFAKGRQFASILEARKFAAEHLGGEVTATGRKALDEAIEFGVTLHARDLVQAAEAAGVEPKAIYDALVALYQAQPLLNEKTADSRLRQAYSTPVPIAYLASKMARIGRDSVVYEPTAGNGALLIGANPDHVIANEIDPARREALAATYPAVTEHDAATWLPGAKIYDAVIANPPFGKVEGKRWQTPKYKTQEIDHAIVFKALEAMKDDGASVLIIGGKKLFGGAESDERLRGLYNTAESRAFFKSLFDLYNVVDHFQISGDLYNRQGAAWPIDVLRIEGRGKSALPLPGVRPPRIYRSFEQLRDLVHGYEDGRVGTTGEHPRPDGGPRAPGDGTVRPPDVPGGVPVGPRPSDDTQGGGGSGARGDHDVPAAEPRLPEPAPKPLGDRTPAGGGTGADAAGGEHTGALPVPGEGGERPGEAGAGDRGPGDVAEPGGAAGKPRSLDDEVAKALQDALDAAFPKEEPHPVEQPLKHPQSGKPADVSEEGWEHLGTGYLPNGAELTYEMRQSPGGRNGGGMRQVRVIQARNGEPRDLFTQHLDHPGGKDFDIEHAWARGDDDDFEIPSDPLTEWEKHAANIRGFLADRGPQQPRLEAPAPKEAPSGGPRAPRARREKQPEETKAAPPTPNDGERSMDDIVRDLDTLFQRAEDDPNEERTDLNPGVDSQKYSKAQPMFREALRKLGGKDGDDLSGLASKLVSALRDAYNYTRERIAAMMPYLQQFLKDVQNGLVKLSDAVSRRRANTEKETKYQTHYEPASDAQPVGTLVPVNMQTAITHAFDKLRERVGNIDDFVAKKLGYSREQVIGTKDGPGYFSAEQVDAIALAIDNLDRGAGFVIGDQTGVGKGRFVAAMMQYAIKQGKVPIFATKSEGLFADIYRDIADIGREGFKGLVTNNDLRGDKRVPLDNGGFIESPPPATQDLLFKQIIKTGRLPLGYDALFTTYSQMQFGKEGKRYQRHDALEALAPKALIILDESHEAGGTETKRIDPDTGEVIPGRADFVRQLLAQAEGAIYSSATYAKNPHVMSLYFKTDMGLAVDKIEDLAPLIKAGGNPLQQAVASMMTEGGQMLRRERSYDGVEMRMNTVPSDRETAERVSSTLRSIFDIDKRMLALREAFGDDLASEGGATGEDNAIGDKGANSTLFSSLMHNIIGQALLSLKTKHAVDEAVAAWKRGEKPIIALSNTFGSLLNQHVEENKLKPGADLSKLNFNRVFQNYLRRTREVTVKDPYDKKKKTRIYISDDKARELGFDELLKDYETLKDQIAKADLASMPSSPLDYMLDEMRKAGMKAGEITGRGLVVENGFLRQRASSSGAKKNTMNAFNSGGLDALIINAAGATGFSLHASEKYKDQQQRHMILLQADPNIDTFMQILGRIHRTGQVVVPKYQLLMTDLPAEKRPAANIMRKLGSLNANTSANRESAVSLDNVVDFMNKYGDEVVGEILNDDPEIADILGIKEAAAGGFKEGVAAQATGRLAILPVAQQEEVYARIERNYKDHIETLNRLGQNALEAKALDLDARTTASRPISEDKGVDSPFAKPAILETVSAKRLGKPYTLDETKDRIAQIVGKKDRTELTRRDTADHVVKLRSDMREKGEEYLNTIRAQHAEAEAAAAALKGAIDPAAEDNSKAMNAIAKAEERAGVLAARLARMQASEQTAQDWLDQTAAGQYVTVTVGSGDAAETFLGATLGVVREGKSKNPFALSSFTAHFAIADGAREIKVPLSKLASGQFKLSPALASDVNRAFESGQAVGREQRSIVTGNLLAGYHAFSGKGMITVFTDSEGNTRPGILLPRGFDADKALEGRPVVLRPDQAITFMERLSEKDAPAFVKSDDGKLTVQRMPDGDYFLKAKVRGGKQFYLNREVNKILGSKQFADRRGSKTSDAEVTAKQLPQILAIYAENLGTRFIAEHERETAREVAAASGGEEPPLFQRAEEDDEDEPRGQTATPEFKRWFGDSKVVNDNGEPLRVYHGTNGNVEMFDPARASTSSMHATAYLGHFFSAAPEIANSFVPSYDDFRQYPGRRTPKNGGNVIPAFLSIAKPFELPLADFREMVRKGGSEAAQSLREHLESQGFDGIKIPGDPKLLDTYGADEWGADTWIAFHSEQIKSATGNRGTFDANDPRIAFQRAEEDHAPPFFSALTRAVEASKQQKAHPSQWQGIIDRLPGIKQEEREWSGVREWLAEQKGPVTKAALLDHIRENEIQIGESLYGERNAPDPELAAKIREFVQLNEHTPQMTKEQEARHEELYGDLRDDNLIDEDGYPSPRGERVLAGKGISDAPTKYHDYQTPGGKNYREMLLTLPTKPKSVAVGEAGPPGSEYGNHEFVAMYEGRHRVDGVKEFPFKIGNQDGRITYWPRTFDWRGEPAPAKYIVDSVNFQNAHFDTMEQAKAAIEKSYEEKGDGLNRGRKDLFRTSHFPEPNILAHVRMNDRTGPNGEKILHVEEIQSDWHQSGRKLGYTENLAPLLTVEEKELQRLNAKSWTNEPLTAEEDLRQKDLQRRVGVSLQEKARKVQGGVPNAPFKSTWHELALKRLLRMAAEHGYDKVTWTTGEQQAERYDLSKQVQQIRYIDHGNGRYTVWAANEHGGSLSDGLEKNSITKGEVADFVGKEIADKIERGDGRGDPDDAKEKILSGLDLKVGGEGMKGFYDKILPAAANKIGKPFGAKVGETEIHAGDDKLKYVGPEPTTDEEADAIQRRAARDSATVTGQWDDVMHAVDFGDHTFAEAMSEYGSSRLAEIAGGRMEERPQSATVHSLDITPEMRRHALEQGFPMLQRGEAAAGTGGERITRGLAAERPTTDSWQQGEREIAAGVEALRDKMAPGARLEALRNMRATADTGKEGKVHAAYYRDANLADVVAYALGGPHPEASALHEFVHYFRRAGLLDDKEWSALTAAAEKEGWLTPKLAKRYSMLDRDVQLEEAIAERFPQWLQERADKSKSGFMASLPEVFQRLFYKMDLFRRRVADLARRVLGKDATADDVFTRMETGQVGRRDATGIARNEAFARASREEQKEPANSLAERTDRRRFVRTPELQEAVGKLQRGEITRDEYNRLVDTLRPVFPYETVPEATPPEKARAALSADKQAQYGAASRDLNAGDPVQLRLDIPSYQNHNAWVVAVHHQGKGGGESRFRAGKVAGYESVAAATDVEFGMPQKGALKIAEGAAKAPLATMAGRWKPVTPEEAKATAEAAMKSGEWTQVGMDPFRHSYFYDRDTMAPVKSADEVVQVGPLVLAKGVRYGDESETMFSRERDEGENQPPARRVGIIARGSNRITDMLHSAADRALDWGREIQKLATPMAHGDRQADAKDFANSMRLARWDGRWVDNWLKKNFTPEQRTRMFNAAEEESQALQDKRPTEGIGLDRLSGLERDVVEALQARATKAFDQARDLGMHKSPGLPSYVPHMLVQMVDDIAQRMKKKPPSGSPLDPIGRNLSTTTDQLRHRKYKTIEEAEAAARAGGAEGATVVRDIRSLALSTSHLNEAIAGKKLINAIERAGKAAGVETVSIGGIPEGEPTKQWFTIPQHPAFMKYGIKEFVHDPETGGLTPKTDADGKIIFERKPIYVRAEYEGPLRAVLTVPNGKIYNHLMDLKAKTMGLIMYSPLIHNAVEWGRALPAMPGKVLTFRAYFDGNRARNDPETMKRFIAAGLSPIADRGGYQDITSIVNEPNVAPGRSWTAQVLAAVPGLFDPRAGEAVKRAVDKAGDFWHNTLLWDRVADLQMGLAVNMSDSFVKKGLDQQTADRLAAHLANRYAGALPKEAMSNGAQKIANLLAFSRTFTLGNLGAMKDMIVGLPKDVQAQILRDRGLTALDAVQSIAKRKAIATVMLDIGLMYVGNAVLQSAIAVLSGDKTLDEETQGYVRRYQRLLQRGKENPLALLNPFEDLTTLSPLGDNEPNKKDRVRVGAAADGTAVYMRNPVGKIGEEFVGWLTGPLDMVRRKLSTIARPAFQVAANSDSFGHQIYDPYATTPQQWMSNIGKIAMLFIGDQVPLQGIQAARDALAGRGDPNVNAAQVFGPLAGMTFSKGFPGGPATAEKNRIEEQQKYREHEAMPAIRRKIQDGDIDGARKDMADLHMEGWKQKFYLDVTLHPRAHISPKKWQELGRMASPEEFEDLQRMYQQGQH